MEIRSQGYVIQFRLTTGQMSSAFREAKRHNNLPSDIKQVVDTKGIQKEGIVPPPCNTGTTRK